MLATDLALDDLLQMEPIGGMIRFAGQRAVLLDALPVGLLRKALLDSFGTPNARAILTQFGFASGWRAAEALSAEFKWDDDNQLARAGARVLALLGLFRAEAGLDDPAAAAGLTIVDSYEAEQHLMHIGRAEAPACWTLSGLLSGYLSRATGGELVVLEDRCVARGDPACHFIARGRDAWRAAGTAELALFEASQLRAGLDVSFEAVTAALRATEQKLAARRRGLVRVAQVVEEPMGIVSRSPSMRRVIDLARRVARVDSTVLITGESGAGKERIARLVHEESTRATGPFIAVNCGAITETLLESELIGHVRGAFTGASQDRPGLFEAANSGTLLLDEVGEVSTSMQVKLLRLLQEREVRRVGENRSRRIDVRVIAATNRDLAHGVAGGAFRQDLYYRLKVVELHVPALRERREDILPLARVMLAEAATWMKRRITGLAPEALERLLQYPWPGNVRELENAMERAVALARGSRVELEDLPEEIRGAVAKDAAVTGPVRPLVAVEKDYILAALALNNGNQTRTAEQLEIGSATLYRKLKSYGVTRTRESRPSA